MNIAIVDDESVFGENLEEILNREFPKIGIRDLLIFRFGSAEEFLYQWKPNAFQIIFLDIYMPGMNGVELAKEIRRSDGEAMLIFSTTSSDFATESYQVRASYYLKKPYDAGAIATMLRHLNISGMKEQPRIYFPDEYWCFLSQISHTVYSNHRIEICLADGSKHSIRMSQTEMGKLILDYENFCQINQGIIVNLEHVSKLEKEQACMKDGTCLPISRSNQKSTPEAYADYCFRQMRKNVLS